MLSRSYFVGHNSSSRKIQSLKCLKLAFFFKRKTKTGVVSEKLG